MAPAPINFIQVACYFLKRSNVSQQHTKLQQAKDFVCHRVLFFIFGTFKHTKDNEKYYVRNANFFNGWKMKNFSFQRKIGNSKELFPCFRFKSLTKLKNFQEPCNFLSRSELARFRGSVCDNGIHSRDYLNTISKILLFGGENIFACQRNGTKISHIYFICFFFIFFFYKCMRGLVPP